MRTQKESEAAIETRLAELPGWSIENAKLHRAYEFRDFEHAFGFMSIAALHIAKLDHHPEWSNVYNRVTVDLTTHDSGGITAKDFEVAEVLEAIAKKLA